MAAAAAMQSWQAEATADLEWDVSRVPVPCHFDAQATHGVDTWKKVDFVFHWPHEKELWLVEVKDPDNPYGSGDPTFMVEDFQNRTLIQQNLAPKAKDSFLYLLLEDKLPEGTRIKYMVLFACDQLNPSKRARYYLAATKELRRRIGVAGPLGRGWTRSGIYIQECLILSLGEWNQRLGGRVPVRRRSAA